MKLIQQRKLFFKEGNSDKVYEIDLCELSANEYLVNFRYGRRGGALKEGTKTATALPFDKAEQIFAALENEKRNKGYQTETETFIELPSLDTIDLHSKNGAILQRLQDAMEGKNSFKTAWKTSRVIWKAGELEIEEATPFILKLATKGDEMQAYASLWALTQLKASQAASLFGAYAFNIRQKAYLRNVAWEGLLTISGEQEQSKVNISLLEQLPQEVRFAIETNDVSLLNTHLSSHSAEGRVEYFSVLYLLCKSHEWLLPTLIEYLKVWAFRPPYFKQIRAIYKLAQLRKDAAVLAILSYRFEKEAAMFRRTSALDSKHKQYLTVIDQLVNVGTELRSKESKLAFSHFTKEYFQKNAVEFLKQSGKHQQAASYLKLAVTMLLQYSEKDYTEAGERPLSPYGQYDYRSKLYYFTLFDYPECSESLLLSTILFGNDNRRQLQANLKFIFGKRIITSPQYYFSREMLANATSSTTTGTTNNATWNRSSTLPGHNAEPESNSIIDAALNVFKGLFGKKKTEEPAKAAMPQAAKEPSDTTQRVQPVQNERLELYPEHWDAMPQAYVQLLMQAGMNIIHRFAYTNLKAHPDLESIVSRFEERSILLLLNSNFELPQQFGFEILEKRAAEFQLQTVFIGNVLNCNNAKAREWARAIIESNNTLFLNDLEFTLLLLFNGRKENESWINTLLDNNPFEENRLQAITGKVIAELLHFENTGNNNEIAKVAIERLEAIAASQMEQISWNIIEQLMMSSLASNKILASKILVRKSKNVAASDIPVSLVEMFLGNENQEVRRNGMQLMMQYPDDFLIRNMQLPLSQLDSVYADVVNAVLVCIRKMIGNHKDIGDKVVSHFVYTLIRKEKFEGSHALISRFVVEELKPYWNTGLKPYDITKLVHAHYRTSQLTGYEILKAYNNPDDFSIGQIVSFGSHEILAIRQWCRSYFEQNMARIRFEKDKALALLDSKWSDTRDYAFHFFKTNFAEADWDADTLIGIVDSIRPDVERFGKEMITLYFKPEYAVEYLTKLSEHPGVNVQAFVTNYLSLYAAGNLELLQHLEFYFRSVLTRVNKARVAKDRIFKFLLQESTKNVATAVWVASIIDDVSAQSSIQDKATCIHILTEIKNCYPQVDMHLMIKNLAHVIRL